jgi:Flp pilus assembly protein TadD
VLAGVDFHHAAYLFAVGRTDLGVGFVGKAAQLVPTNARMLNDLATLLSGEGHLQEGERLWRRAVDVNDRFVLAWENLVKVRLALGDDSGARAALASGLARNPDARALLDLEHMIDYGTIGR